MGINFGERCKQLRRQGFTLSEIVKITGRPKGSVYFHIKSIPISKALKKKRHAINCLNIIGKGPKKGVSRLQRTFRPFTQWETWSVRLVSHILFDGSIRKDGVVYHNRSLRLVDGFCADMANVCDFLPRRYFTAESVYRAAFYNVEMRSFWNERVSSLINHLLSLNQNLQREFLKAFFNDEGSIYFNSASRVRRVTGVQYDHDILRLVQNVLINFKILATIDEYSHAVVITGLGNLIRFQDEIGFDQGLRVNGNRSNSVWKESLEKREILRRAIESYTTKIIPGLGF